jgi:hypothetical protein
VPSANLNLKNPEGRALRGAVRVMHDHEMSHLVQVQKTRQAIGTLPTETQLILAQTMRARGALAAAIVGLTDEQIERKPAPEAWSVKEIVEHVLAYDPVLLERIRTAFGAEKPK